MSVPVLVLDASVGVKWFRDEPGSDEAHRLLTAHRTGGTILAVDTLFIYEVLGAISRSRVRTDIEGAWRDLATVDLAVVPLGQELVAAAAAQRAVLGCSLYDAFSAGLASLLRAPLVSADARAHGSFPGVRLMDA